MPPRSKIEQLPSHIREELDRRLIRSGFGSYEKMSRWLKGEGYQISRSSVGRYSNEFEDYCQSIKLSVEKARAIVGEIDDDGNALSEALLGLVQHGMFSSVVALQEGAQERGEAVPPATYAKIARSVADLARASVQQKKFLREVRERAKAAAAEVDRQLKAQKGLSPEIAADIRAKILGIVA